jgi:hypothetical protein
MYDLSGFVMEMRHITIDFSLSYLLYSFERVKHIDMFT